MDQLTTTYAPSGVTAATPHLCVLAAAMRDLSGALLPAGTTVLRNLMAPDEVYEASDRRWGEFERLGFAWTAATRQRLWQPSPAPALADTRADEFRHAIDHNLRTATGQAMPMTRATLASALLPVRSIVKRVPPAVADLSAALLSELVKQSGLPAECGLTDAYRAMLGRVNSASVYRIEGSIGWRAHAVIAYISPPRFALGSEVKIDAVGATHLEMLLTVFQQWVKTSRASAGSFVFYSVGAGSFAGDLRPQVSGDSLFVLSAPVDGGQWNSAVPLELTERPAVRDFADRLKPQTREQRAVIVADAVRARVADGFRGSIDAGWLSEKTGLRNWAVRTAMFDLQDGGRHHLYRNDRKLLCIEPSDHRKPVTIKRRKGLGRLYHFRQVLATGVTTALAIAAGVLRERAVHGIILAAPLSWLAALLLRYWTEATSFEE